MPKIKPLGLLYKKAVVDNGPLFALLTLVFVRQWPQYRREVLSKHKLESYVLQKERDYLDFFDGINQLLFTSHVIGQTRTRDLKRLPPHIFREFWLCSLDYLKRKRVDERLLTLLSMREDQFICDVVCSLGPADAGLLALARAEKCVLLTDDNRLFSWCDGDGAPEIGIVEHLL